NFILIYCKCPVKICEKRDPKGLYKLAREGKIKNYTGISSPYEEPIAPDLTIDTSEVTIQGAVNRILEFISPKIFLS
ncbi:MAG: adenylyl-sulfate kinase, partial [Candidatus Kryptonium sp.]